MPPATLTVEMEIMTLSVAYWVNCGTSEHQSKPAMPAATPVAELETLTLSAPWWEETLAAESPTAMPSARQMAKLLPAQSPLFLPRADSIIATTAPPTPDDVNSASDLAGDSATAGTYAGASWNSAADITEGAWNFGTGSEYPALVYADYDGAGAVYSCDNYPEKIPASNTNLVCGNNNDSLNSLVGNYRHSPSP